MGQAAARDRLIVALDVPTAGEALGIVSRLGSTVSFYKVGWQLFMSGEWKELLDGLGNKRVFIDLKLPGDIGNTLRNAIQFCVDREIRFLTLSENVPPETIAELIETRGSAPGPKLLSVLFWSHLDGKDAVRHYGEAAADFDAFIRDRARSALDSGCDGVIASGDSIGTVRKQHPDTTLVSPGIRMVDSSTDDHKRSTTPDRAIRLGADYLVVGRPVVQAADPLEAANRIIEGIGEGLRQATETT